MIGIVKQAAIEYVEAAYGADVKSINAVRTTGDAVELSGWFTRDMGGFAISVPVVVLLARLINE